LASHWDDERACWKSTPFCKFCSTFEGARQERPLFGSGIPMALGSSSRPSPPVDAAGASRFLLSNRVGDSSQRRDFSGSSTIATTVSLARALRPHPSAVDLDSELRAWLQESHDVVGMQSDLAERRVAQAKSRRHR
jgi:hypothetical protein